MPLNLSIKNVPDELVAELRARAKRHHRSLQGELLAVLEEACCPGKLTVMELRRRVDEMGLRTASEAEAMVREMRDAG
ncbi:MAG: Arc family DNA-binding protein [Candidatus Rokubacteria bacterium]|nr:Arc family DNA-binding protein [Candidatus Rokubacteria bacterium]